MNKSKKCRRNLCFLKKDKKTKNEGAIYVKKSILGAFVEIVCLLYFKILTPILLDLFIIFIKKTKPNQKKRSLVHPVLYLCFFEIRHLKRQDGGQLDMQIRIIFYFSLLLNPSVLDTKYEVSRMSNKKVFLVHLPNNYLSL